MSEKRQGTRCEAGARVGENGEGVIKNIVQF